MSARLACVALCLTAFVLPSPGDAQTRRPGRRQPAPRRTPRQPPPPPPPPPPPEVVEPVVRTGPDPFSEPAPAPLPPVEAPPPAEAAHHPRVDIELQYRLFTRSMSWDDDAMRSFRPYDLDAASAFRVAGEVYPFAFATDGAISHLALQGAFGMAVALDSQDSRGRRYETTAYETLLGLRYRIPLRPDQVDLGVGVAWTRQVFYVRASETQALGGVPDLVYDGLRVGLSARVPIAWRLGVRIDLGFTYVLAAGEIQEKYLPHVSAIGVDGALALTVRIWRGLEARVGAELRQMMLSANREPTDRYVTTGATDRYITGTLGVAWRY